MSASDHEKVIFDPHQYSIRRGSREVQLGRQMARCLALMIVEAGQIISKDEIVDRCWRPHGSHVSGNSVRQTFFKLRRALGEAGAPPGILQTMPGRGYYLVPDSVLMAHGQVTPGTTAQDAASPSIRAARPTLPLRCLLIALAGFALAGAGAFLRSLLLVPPLDWRTAGQTDGMTWFVQDGYRPPADVRQRIRHWLGQPQAGITGSRFFYITRAGRGNLTFFACLKPMEQGGNGCVSVSVIGREDAE